MALLSSLKDTSQSQVFLSPGKKQKSKPKRVQKARLKSWALQDGPHDKSTKSNKEGSKFHDRFFSLPGELRNHIYRQLLVRPCKFDMYHSEPCATPFPYSKPGPRSALSDIEYPCANCNSGNRWLQHPQLQIFKSPARSQWAKPHPNEYLCDNCYWDRIGIHRDDPCMRSLRCLCARHRDLSILLVNKWVYNEAAPIFWSENYFAFEHPCLLIGFLSTIRPQIRSWIRRISFLPIHDGITYKDKEDPAMWYPQELDRVWQGWPKIKSCWQLLRECEGLMELELDVMFLKRLDWALLIRLVHVQGKVIFSRHPVVGEIDDRWRRSPRFIWRSHSRRIEVKTPTTDLMAGSMMQNRAIKTKKLKRHLTETTFSERYGGDFYSNLDRY